MALKKVKREAAITCHKFAADNKTTEEYTSLQTVTIEEEENGEVYSSIGHNGESLTMSLDNLLILYKLIGGAVAEYYQ